jgi:hypothetical protein
VECICVPKTSYFKKEAKIMIKKINLLAGDREADHEANLKPIKSFVSPPMMLPVRSAFGVCDALQAWRILAGRRRTRSNNNHN